jgi:hypothetical protein
MKTCPSEETLLDYIENKLSDKERMRKDKWKREEDINGGR